METTSQPGSGGGKLAVDQTAANVHQVVDKIAGAAVPAIDRLAVSAHKTVDKIARTATPAAEWIEQSAHKLNQSRIKMLEDGKQCVRDHPLAAVGTAIAVGALLGYLMRSRH